MRPPPASSGLSVMAPAHGRKQSRTAGSLSRLLPRAIREPVCTAVSPGGVGGGMSGLVATAARRLRDPRDVRAGCYVAALLLVAEAALCFVIVWKVPYTEIDWVAYMQEVGGFLGGERDYAKLTGGTGPLVYPAGFVYIYSALHWATSGGHIPTAQVIFVGLYLINQAVVFAIYIRSRLTPPWVLVLLCLSKRMHSIFVLRLFNDCFAMLAAYLAVLVLQGGNLTLAVVLFSAGVSIKMNVLLMAPPVLAVVVKGSNPQTLLGAVVLGSLLQIVLGLPFLASFPWSYLSRAFELSRVFQHKWTVNLKFLPPDMFVSGEIALGLLASHLLLLAAWAAARWFSPEGGLPTALGKFYERASKGGRKLRKLHPGEVAMVVFTGNLIGIAAARTLHYQFYSWYFHTLPLLLWAVPGLPTVLRLSYMLCVEWAFNVYPASAASSAALSACHVLLLVCLWATGPVGWPPVATNDSKRQHVD